VEEDPLSRARPDLGHRPPRRPPEAIAAAEGHLGELDGVRPVEDLFRERVVASSTFTEP
jgi:hypothetical protein